jgi:hypothetical protein
MTPAEKAIHAVNARIERLQARLREANAEPTRRFLFESVLVTIGIGEALTDYIKTVGDHARRRHGELKASNAALETQHAELLKSGQQLLEQLKANPTDRAIRKEIDGLQQGMATIQKNLRRGANALQRDVAPGLAKIDALAESVRKVSDAEQIDALKRVLKTIVQHVHELYVTQRTLPAKDTIDATAWEKSALTEIDRATDLHDAYARAGYQAILALEIMRLAMSETPPQTNQEATRRGNEAVTARIKQIAGRFTPGNE